MKSFAEIKNIKYLNDQGYSKTEISNMAGVSLPTVDKYIKSEIVIDNKHIDYDLKTPLSILPYIEKIDSYLKQNISNSKKIELLIKAQGYIGSYQSLNNYINLKKKSLIRDNSNSYFRIETEPGEQAQVDWGHFGTVIINETKLNLYCFVYVLSYSRATYIEFVTSQKQKVLQSCHVNAFLYLGGVPQKIRYDNMKTVIISREKVGGIEELKLNHEFSNFAKYYNFKIEVCPRYYPRSKGKVEAKVKYVRRNFFNGEVFGKTFYSVDELNKKAKSWLDAIQIYAGIQ